MDGSNIIERFGSMFKKKPETSRSRMAKRDIEDFPTFLSSLNSLNGETVINMSTEIHSHNEQTYDGLRTRNIKLYSELINVFTYKNPITNELVRYYEGYKDKDDKTFNYALMKPEQQRVLSNSCTLTALNRANSLLMKSTVRSVIYVDQDGIIRTGEKLNTLRENLLAKNVHPL